MDLDLTALATYVLSWLAVIGLGVALIAAPFKWYRRRREAHYRANPDPLFGGNLDSTGDVDP